MQAIRTCLAVLFLAFTAQNSFAVDNNRKNIVYTPEFLIPELSREFKPFSEYEAVATKLAEMPASEFGGRFWATGVQKQWFQTSTAGMSLTVNYDVTETRSKGILKWNSISKTQQIYLSGLVAFLTTKDLADKPSPAAFQARTLMLYTCVSAYAKLSTFLVERRIVNFDDTIAQTFQSCNLISQN